MLFLFLHLLEQARHFGHGNVRSLGLNDLVNDSVILGLVRLCTQRNRFKQNKPVRRFNKNQLTYITDNKIFHRQEAYRHEEITITVGFYLFHWLTRVIRNVLVEQSLGKENFLGLKTKIKTKD